VPAFENLTNNVVSNGNGATQALGQTWNFIPAHSGSDAGQYNDGYGTGANRVYFGAVSPPYMDTFYQVVNATLPTPESWTYSFLYSNDSGEPTVLRVFASTTLSVPEPSTWAMMALGFAGLGFAGFRTTRRAVAVA
jgi:hypothetical protein